MIVILTREDREQFERLRSLSIDAGAGKMRYAAAMYFYQRGTLSDTTLEIYRSLAKDDCVNPVKLIETLGRRAEIEETIVMKPVDAKDRRVTNIYSAEFKPFVYDDGKVYGDSVLQNDDALPLGVGFHVYRMPAGMTTRAHRHNGHEQFLILEGELIENDGTVYSKGDLVWLRDGTEHCSTTPNGCLLAVHIAGPEFSLE